MTKEELKLACDLTDKTLIVTDLHLKTLNKQEKSFFNVRLHTDNQHPYFQSCWAMFFSTILNMDFYKLKDKSADVNKIILFHYEINKCLDIINKNNFIKEGKYVKVEYGWEYQKEIISESKNTELSNSELQQLVTQLNGDNNSLLNQVLMAEFGNTSKTA